MKKEYQDIISEHLGVRPIEINSNIFSAQNRKRLYWTNITVNELPEDKGIFLKDVIESDALPITLTERRTEEARTIRKESMKNGKDFSPRRAKELIPREDGKSNCLTATFSNKEHLIALNEYLTEDQVQKTLTKYAGKKWKSGNRMGTMQFPDRLDKKARTITTNNAVVNRETMHIHDGIGFRRLTVKECERLQTLPDDYTKGNGPIYISSSQRYKMIGNGWTVDVIAHILKGLGDER